MSETEQKESQIVRTSEMAPLATLVGPNVKTIYATASELAAEANKIIEKHKLYNVIKGKKHLRFEAWQAIATPLGLFAKVKSIDELPQKGGYRAYVAICRSDGIEIAGASASCSRDEDSWTDEGDKAKDDYAVESMAQTRAASKAFRMILAWIPSMVGYEAATAEEVREHRGGQGATATTKSEEGGRGKKAAGTGEPTIRNRLFAALGGIEKNNDKARALFTAITGKEKSHDVPDAEIEKLVNVLHRVKKGEAEVVYNAAGHAYIKDKPTGAVLFGVADAPAPAKEEPPKSEPAKQAEQPPTELEPF